MWRAYSNCLPTRTNLRDRHIQLEVHCVLCNDAKASLEYLFSQTTKISYPFFAETLTFKEALSWTKNNGYSNVIFESYSLSLIQAIKENLSSLSYSRAIISNCVSLLSELSNCYVVFVCRSANTVTHTLATYEDSQSGL
uniref:RNase H type-1 domain-containing protein n=1 Tax=Manihot esculenta TaxID=3983 RepID=A0A2C9V9B4_MANES